MKTTLDLPDELIRHIKIRAVKEGRPLKRLVADLLRQGLNSAAAPSNPPTASGQVLVAGNGLPIFRCGPNAPVSRMTAEELIALEKEALEEEDLRRAGIPL